MGGLVSCFSPFASEQVLTVIADDDGDCADIFISRMQTGSSRRGVPVLRWAFQFRIIGHCCFIAQ